MVAPAYLGLDPSLTSFGVAAIGPGLDKTWVIKSPKQGVDRLLHISYQLGDIFSEVKAAGHTIDDVAIEDTVLMSHSASVLGELAGVTKTTCNVLLKGQARYPLKVPPTTLKKYATGRGNAKKIEIILSIYKKWDREFRDDNEADAYVLARIASGHAELVYEKETLAKLQSSKFRDRSEEV